MRAWACEFESCTCHNKDVIGKEGKGKTSSQQSTSLEKLATTTLVSAKLEIECAMQFFHLMDN